MKVQVLQVDQATFKRFRWWSNWVDICVFNFSSQAWLMQMRVSRTNAKQFKTRCMTGFSYRQITVDQVGDLIPMTNDKLVGKQNVGE